MGFDLRDSGFHILLAKDVPEMIGGKIGGLSRASSTATAEAQDSRAGFCIPGSTAARKHRNGAWPVQVRHAAVMGHSRNVGNLSSATILFILQEWMEKRPLQPGEYALAAAFGPGFSAEFLLLQWT